MWWRTWLPTEVWRLECKADGILPSTGASASSSTCAHADVATTPITGTNFFACTSPVIIAEQLVINRSCLRTQPLRIKTGKRTPCNRPGEFNELVACW